MGKVLSFFAAVLQVLAFNNVVDAAPPTQRPMTFSVEKEGFADRVVRESLQNGRWDIYASGAITAGTEDRFQNFVRLNRIENARVHLDSLGGNLLEGLRLGLAIRELGFDTIVSARRTSATTAPTLCASACAYAFAGGVGRFSNGPKGLLGLHQFYGSSSLGSVSDTQATSALILSYLSRMGIKANAYVLASLATPDTVHWLTVKEAADSGFVNEGIQATTAELKTLDLQPYLKLEQARHDVMVRVLLACAPGQASVAVGLVTTPETSQLHAVGNARSYIDLDYKETLPISGDAGVEASGSVLWIRRNVDASFLSQILGAKTLGGHAYAGGVLTWGDSLDLGGVREQLQAYIGQCRAALR